MPPTQKTPARELTRIEQLLDVGDYKEALQVVETLEKRADLPPKDRLTCQLLKSMLLNNMGKYQESIRLTEPIINENQEWRTRLHLIDALISRAEVLGFLGRYDEGLNVVGQCEHELTILAQSQPEEVPQRKAA